MKREEGPLKQTVGVHDAERPRCCKKSLTAARGSLTQKERDLRE